MKNLPKVSQKVNSYLVIMMILVMTFLIVPVDVTLAQEDVGMAASLAADPAILTSETAYQGIVKINTFFEDVDYIFDNIKSGSGVIIDSNGLILTNSHVVDVQYSFDGSEAEASYQVCLTEDISEAPNCSYAAKLVAKDEDLDIALLKIQTISGLSSQSGYSYLDLSESEVDVSDGVTALGYPSIGGDTITITDGIISGKSNKYGNKWFKTDAIISYGSSGGAAIDVEGKLVGITTQVYSDYLGSVGYIMDITSVNDWINENKNKTPQSSSLLNELIDFTKQQKELETSNLFENSEPSFSITKPRNWDFAYNTKSVLYISNYYDGDGQVAVYLQKFPYLTQLEDVTAHIKRLYYSIGFLTMVDIKESNVNINGQAGQKITVSLAGAISNYYVFPVEDYLVVISYDYGTDDSDKETVDNIIETFTITESNNNFNEVSYYSHSDPEFTLSVNDDWAIKKMNNPREPLMVYNKNLRGTYVVISLEKTDDNTKDFDSEDYLENYEQELKASNQAAISLDSKFETLESDTHYKLNDNIPNVLMIKSALKSISTDEIFLYDVTYNIRAGDVYIQPYIHIYSDDEEVQNEYVASFNEMMQSFTAEDVLAAVDSDDDTGDIDDVDDTDNQDVPDNTVTPESVLDIIDTGMYERLKGQIVLQVEANGEAYYIHPSEEKMYYLGRPDDAFSVMRNQGVGIVNEYLEKIPIGLSDLSGDDTDGDGLSDIFEDAMGTDKAKKDTDGDGFSDKEEVERGDNPMGSGKIVTDTNFANKHKGKIFLQVEGNGEAWYVNPSNGKRYFLGRPADAFEIMRNLGLGISNDNFDKLN